MTKAVKGGFVDTAKLGREETSCQRSAADTVSTKTLFPAYSRPLAHEFACCVTCFRAASFVVISAEVQIIPMRCALSHYLTPTFLRRRCIPNRASVSTVARTLVGRRGKERNPLQ